VRAESVNPPNISVPLTLQLLFRPSLKFAILIEHLLTPLKKQRIKGVSGVGIVQDTKVIAKDSRTFDAVNSRMKDCGNKRKFRA